MEKTLNSAHHFRSVSLRIAEIIDFKRNPELLPKNGNLPTIQARSQAYSSFTGKSADFETTDPLCQDCLLGPRSFDSNSSLRCIPSSSHHFKLDLGQHADFNHPSNYFLMTNLNSTVFVN